MHMEKIITLLLKKKLKTLFSLIKERIGNVEGRVFVDCTNS